MNFRDPESQLSGSLFSCEEINQGVGRIFREQKE
jgi:hypothetical protein